MLRAAVAAGTPVGPEGQGHHGSGRSGARRCRGRDHRRPHRRSRTPGTASSSTAFRARSRRPRRSTACSTKRACELDAVIELKVDEGILLDRIESRIDRDAGARRAAARRRQSGGAQEAPRRLPGPDRAAGRLLPAQGRAAGGRRHGPDRRRDPGHRPGAGGCRVPAGSGPRRPPGPQTPAPREAASKRLPKSQARKSPQANAQETPKKPSGQG